MSNLSRFMKSNKIERKNTTYAATKSLLDENGEPMLWTIRPMTTKENDAIRDDCTIDVPVTGKPNLFRPKLVTSKYMAKLAVKSIVEPNLYDKELQDSYGVMTPEDLLQEMIDNPNEYGELVNFIQEFNDFTPLDEKVDAAKLINEGDSEANFAYYCLHKFHILPSQYLEMEENERAFVIACIKIRIEEEKKKKDK